MKCLRSCPHCGACLKVDGRADGKRRTWTDAQVIAAVKASNTFAGLGRKLGMSDTGARKIVTTHGKRLRLNTSHFQWQRDKGGNGA